MFTMVNYNPELDMFLGVPDAVKEQCLIETLEHMSGNFDKLVYNNCLWNYYQGTIPLQEAVLSEGFLNISGLASRLKYLIRQPFAFMLWIMQKMNVNNMYELKRALKKKEAAVEDMIEKKKRELNIEENVISEGILTDIIYGTFKIGGMVITKIAKLIWKAIVMVFEGITKAYKSSFAKSISNAATQYPIGRMFAAMFVLAVGVIPLITFIGAYIPISSGFSALVYLTFALYIIRESGNALNFREARNFKEIVDWREAEIDPNENAIIYVDSDIRRWFSKNQVNYT